MKTPPEISSNSVTSLPIKSTKGFQQWPWLTLQIIAANVVVVVALATAWYLVFTHQSSVYSERLMSAFNIEPGSLHAMYVDDVERQLWTSVFIGLVFAVFASIGLAFLIARPLRSLTNATERLRKGDYRVRSTIQAGEVGRLAENVNALAYALEQEEQRRAQFMADLGHELRTPIMSLRGYTEGLEDGIFEADDSYFKLMTSEFRHLTALTHTIETMRLDSSSREREQSQPTKSITNNILNAENRWRSRFEQRNLLLKTEIPTELGTIFLAASDRSFQQIIDNLLSNTLRYASTQAACRIQASKGNEKDTISLKFSNHAPDVTSDALPFLFDRFFRISTSRTRVDDARPSGLGLSVVKQMCLANGGDVGASLNNGRLTFTVVLPIRTPASTRTNPRALESPTLLAQKARYNQKSPYVL
jgi:signal transduction histidine kinase